VHHVGRPNRCNILPKMADVRFWPSESGRRWGTSSRIADVQGHARQLGV